MDKTNCSEFDPIKSFQPMPKRFKVWDMASGEWREWKVLPDRQWQDVFEAHQLATFLVNAGVAGQPYTRFKIVQSTNLFDEDGKEIFEGSIIQICRSYGYGLLPKGAIGMVYFDKKELCYKISGQGEYRLTASKKVKVVGHILSNPELLEEK